jgi:hypothetical protein
MKKITLILPVKKDLNKVFKLLNILEKIPLPKEYFYEVAVFFQSQEFLECFCSYSKKYANLKIFFCQDLYDASSFNIVFEGLQTNRVYFLSLEEEIDSTFFTSLVSSKDIQQNHGIIS